MNASAYRKRKVEISLREKKVISKKEYGEDCGEYLEYLYSLLSETGGKDVIDAITGCFKYYDGGGLSKTIRILALRHYYDTTKYLISIANSKDNKMNVLYMFLGALKSYKKDNAITFIKDLGIKTTSNKRILFGNEGVKILTLLLEAGVEINFSELLSSQYLRSGSDVKKYLNEIVENEV